MGVVIDGAYGRDLRGELGIDEGGFARATSQQDEGQKASARASHVEQFYVMAWILILLLAATAIAQDRSQARSKKVF